MPRLQYEKDVGGTLEYYPPEGVSSAATVVAYTSGTTTLFSSGPVTLDTFSQTGLTAAEGARDITVSSSANAVVGRRYWVTPDPGADGYEDRIIGIPDATSVMLETPLKVAMAGSGTIKGHGLRRTLSTTEAGTLRERCRLVWRYTVGGIAYMHSELFDIVYWPFSLSVTEEELELADTAFGGQTGARGSWRKHVALAERDMWQALEGIGVRPDLVRSRDLLQLPFIYRTLYHRHRNDEAKAKIYAALYGEAWSHFTGSKDAWYDSNDDLCADLAGNEVTVYVGDDPVTMWRLPNGTLTSSAPALSSGSAGEVSGLPGGYKLKVL